MADSAYFPRLASEIDDIAAAPRHSVLVRLTHWLNALSFIGLLVSGVAILLAHPRLYWGETGTVGTPSLIDLPLPFVLVGQSGWGRSLHFQSAWACILTGLIYVLSSLLNRHFRRDLLPSRADLSPRRISRVVSDHVHFRIAEDSGTYNLLQRLAYLGVVFLLLPLMILTGLAMSPAVVSVIPAIVTVFGGQQSARTIHFFVASSLVLFLIVHVAMVSLTGFTSRLRSMTIGSGGKDLA